MDGVCEWCKRPGEVAEVYDAAGKKFVLCEDCRDAVASFIWEKYARAYNLAQSITGGS